MRRLSIGSTLVAAGIALVAATAQADVVMLNDLETQTIPGQDFTFTFTGLDPSDGTGATFILRAQGDYEGLPPPLDTETLSWRIDGGIASAGPVGGFVPPCAGGEGGPFDFCHEIQALGNVEWQRTYPLSAATTNALLADGALSIFVDLSDDVGLFAPPNFVEVTFIYNSGTTPPPPLPEPATWTLLTVGLAALGASRRTRARVA